MKLTTEYGYGIVVENLKLKQNFVPTLMTYFATETRRKDYLDLFVPLRFGNKIINPDEIFVIRCDLSLSNKSILETSFRQSNAKLREDDHTVVETKAEHFDTTLYPFSLVLPYKLLSGKVKEISHLTVFLPEHIYSNSDIEISIDELAFIITNENTGDAITIAIETENADIEVRNKP